MLILEQGLNHNRREKMVAAGMVSLFSALKTENPRVPLAVFSGLLQAWGLEAKHFPAIDYGFLRVSTDSKWLLQNLKKYSWESALDLTIFPSTLPAARGAISVAAGGRLGWGAEGAAAAPRGGVRAPKDSVEPPWKFFRGWAFLVKLNHFLFHA